MTDYLKTPAGDVQRSPVSRDHPTATWLSLTPTDAPLRSQIRGEAYEAPQAVHVIVEDSRECDRLFHAWGKTHPHAGAVSQLVKFLRDA